MATDPVEKLRALCLRFPGTVEKEAWGEPTFRATKIFAICSHADNRHGAGRPAVWIKANASNQALLIESDPARYFKPPYVGPAGWIGVWLDCRPQWTDVASLLDDGYRQVAPKKLLAELDARSLSG